MNTKFIALLGACLLVLSSATSAQHVYRYSVDLTKVKNDELKIELLTPSISEQEIVFYMPRIVPGTYINSDFGKFVHGIKAFDKSGKELPVTAQADSNSWRIKKATRLYKITYNAEDTWDTKIKHTVYEMAGTNFEEGKNFVLNTCGIFGYFEGMKKDSFELSFIKPAGFYASTGLIPESSSNTTDIFKCENADRLYDSPIMFCLPDTTFIRVGNTDILVSVYSPKKQVTSKYVAEHLSSLLEAAKNYLGGKLPVNKYAFIYYFNSEQETVHGQGAWEHSYSSFYSMNEGPEEKIIDNIVDFSSHEFFHIVTPLNICSREVREFNFNQTILSKHLWLYEGSTEYDAHHTQVTSGLISSEEFLKRLSEKIFYSRKFLNDSLSFTELSVGSADKYNSQYINVYQKGALISACLDLYLYKLSGGVYGIKDLKHDLSIRYGPTNYFNENELFDEIAKLTYPEVRAFFTKYVEGTTPLPYEEFFGYAGVKYSPKREVLSFTLGGASLTVNGKSQLVVNATDKMNDFGKTLGYKKDDILLSLNGESIDASTSQSLVNKFYGSAKEGDPVKVEVLRKDDKGGLQTVILSAPAMKVKKTEEHVLEFDSTTAEQLRVRNAWLNTPCNK